jgi:hypothetical protein
MSRRLRMVIVLTAMISVPAACGSPASSPAIGTSGPSTARVSSTSTTSRAEATGFLPCSYSEPSAALPPLLRPGDFQYNCGAAHPYTWIIDARWSSWGATVAQASAVLVQNTCTPDCAAANNKSSAVTIELSDPGQIDGHLLFRAMDITFTDGLKANIDEPVPGACPSYGGVGC